MVSVGGGGGSGIDGGIGGGGARMKEPGFGPSNTVIWFAVLWANLYTLYHRSVGLVLVWLDCRPCQGSISIKSRTWDSPSPRAVLVACGQYTRIGTLHYVYVLITVLVQ